MDDVEGTLANFIPPGTYDSLTYPQTLRLLNIPFWLIDYVKDESAFTSRVEEDATTFKPLGDLIYSYTRPAPGVSGKGKGVVRSEALDPDGEDAVGFEVYHVSEGG